jgi:microcin C transport system substrate-binding protein
LRSPYLSPAALLLACTISACGGDNQAVREAPASPATATPSAPINTDKNAYPVFVNADAGADASVTPEQGGKGFTGQGWETNTDFDLIGDPHAVKGGLLRLDVAEFPGTLRMAGPEWNTATNYMVSSMVYETLLGLHSTTLEYVPSLATHWQVLPDKLTFRFRVDPNARFSDGTPVTADDVVASWTFHTDKGLQDLFFYTEYNNLEKPVAESKYIVRMKAKKLNWRNLMIASGMRIFPANALKTLDGASYLRDYNFKLLPGTGPYTMTEADVKKGTSVSIRRRPDYWAAKYRANVGQYNFDEIRNVVVRDRNLAFEMFKKGQLDFHYVNISQRWVEELNFDNVQRGLIVKRKVFNNYPASTQFIAFNTRRAPWNDIRVRQAFALMLNRQQLIERLFFKEYMPLASFFPGTDYENVDNPKDAYDPQQGLKLLAEAGWNEHDGQGRLTKGGQPLQVEYLYADKGSERWLTIYQDDLRKVGISLNLRLVNGETLFKMTNQRQFEMAQSGFGSGSVFPIPGPEYHSRTDIPNTNNLTGFHDKRIDEICDQYDVEFDPIKRKAMLKELDGILTNMHHVVFQWYPPAERIAFWNRYGMPAGTFSRVGDFAGSLAPGIPQLWWVDPAKEQALQAALRDTSKKLDVPAVEDKYWQDYTNAHGSQPTTVK